MACARMVMLLSCRLNRTLHPPDSTRALAGQIYFATLRRHCSKCYRAWDGSTPEPPFRVRYGLFEGTAIAPPGHPLVEPGALSSRGPVLCNRGNMDSR